MMSKSVPNHLQPLNRKLGPGFFGLGRRKGGTQSDLTMGQMGRKDRTLEKRRSPIAPETQLVSM
jgi:hypothetical protein